MIGFELNATSNTRFTRNYTQWTEGEVWLAKAFEVVRGISSPAEMVLGQAWSAAIESPADAATAAFKGLLNGMLADLAGVRNQMGVTVEGVGGTFFCHGLLNINESGIPMIREFLATIKRASDAYGREIGDQVMIQICKTIKMFDLHLGLGNAVGHLWIEIKF
ncbi:MAG: hypothetical protein IPJ30_12275 [Acidobacteria bacterium]|nr:hypothetical protein [Acidobacteriota bacterium]